MRFRRGAFSLTERFRLAVAALALSIGGASAAEPYMPLGSLTSQPIGHYEFCKIYVDECQVRPTDQRPLLLTHDLWNTILTINGRINAVIHPASDIDLFGKDEVWTFPDRAGDCEDYVLLKRQLLINEGISPANLLITVVRKPDGEGHAVLSVRTDRGDLVLDNLTSTVKLWNETGYSFLKRQSSLHTGRWVAIEQEAPTVVGSVR